MKLENDGRPEDIEDVFEMLPQKYRLAILVRAANKTMAEIERNEKISEGNQEEMDCSKCDEPQFVTQFPKHVRNCDG